MVTEMPDGRERLQNQHLHATGTCLSGHLARQGTYWCCVAVCCVRDGPQCMHVLLVRDISAHLLAVNANEYGLHLSSIWSIKSKHIKHKCKCSVGAACYQRVPAALYTCHQTVVGHMVPDQQQVSLGNDMFGARIGNRMIMSCHVGRTSRFSVSLVAQVCGAKRHRAVHGCNAECCVLVDLLRV